MEDDPLLKLIARHFVALAVEYESLNDDGSVFHQSHALLSGFVIDLDGEWFWVTAGHCFKTEIHRLLNEGEIRITDGGGFLDHFGMDAKHTIMLPYTYEEDAAFFVEDPEEGLDYAVIRLRPYYANAFAKNGVVAIDRQNWLHQYRLEFEHHCMVGIPAQHVEFKKSADGQTVGIAPRVYRLYVEKLNPSDIPNSSSDEWFCGRVHCPPKVTDLKGTSGGPIFGFRKTDAGQWSYHVVALQSRWRPDSDIIFGCRRLDPTRRGCPR